MCRLRWSSGSVSPGHHYDDQDDDDLDDDDDDDVDDDNDHDNDPDILMETAMIMMTA